MKSCKTVWPALKPSDGFKTVRILHRSLTYIYVLMRDDKEGGERMKQARSNKQQVYTIHQFTMDPGPCFELFGLESGFILIHSRVFHSCNHCT